MNRILLSVAFAALVVTSSPAADSFSGEAAAIAKARDASNTAIVSHDANLVGSFFTDDIHVTSGNGMELHGKATIRDKFTAQFVKFSDLSYIRTPARIEVSASYPLAVEHGTWTGHWTDTGKSVEVRGDYLAMWRKTGDTWLIRSELFVTLERRENGTVVQRK